MATIRKFEELDCWNSAQELLVKVYFILNKTEVKREFSFQDQMKRSSLSVSNNIAEGFERRSNKERIRYLEIALGSTSEIKNMVYAALALKFIDQSEFDSTFALCEKCQKQIKGFMRYLHSLKK